MRLRRAATRLETALARPPTRAELAKELGLSPHRVDSIQHWDREYVSLDAPIGADQEACLADVLPDREQPTPDEAASHRDLRKHLEETMDVHLAPDERAYLTARFGLDGGPPHTQLQAAHRLGLTYKQAAQLEKRALRRLRRSRTLQDWRI